MLANFLRIVGGMLGLAVTHVLLVQTILVRPGAGVLGLYHLIGEVLALPWIRDGNTDRQLEHCSSD